MLLWSIAFLIGIVLGMFGAGGGMITVPVLIYVGDLPVKEAVAMSLWIVAIVSLVALFQNKYWHKLQFKMIATLGLTGMLGSVSGSVFSHWLPEKIQLGLFSVLVLLVTWWVSKMELSDRVGVFEFIPASVAGFIIGFLTGIFGVGGGFLLVPALIYLGMQHFPTAVAHSLVLISLNALAGGIVYLNKVQIPMQDTLVFAAVAAGGTVLGAYILQRIESDRLQKSFSLVLVTMAFFMAWRAIRL